MRTCDIGRAPIVELVDPPQHGRTLRVQVERLVAGVVVTVSCVLSRYRHRRTATQVTSADSRPGASSAQPGCARGEGRQDGGMERVRGIGGYFVRAVDPAALSAWYRECLGLDADEHGLWSQEPGPTVFATFESDTDYFGSRTQQTMLNFRVRDLDAMLAQLRAAGADVADETQDLDGVGRFGWVTDPAGTRIELWQPASSDSVD
jgi:predicted enzyme related to lactoylglutathione lyase